MKVSNPHAMDHSLYEEDTSTEPTATGRENKNKNAPDSEEHRIAGKEERRVQLSKIVVVTVFVVFATVVSVATYLFTKDAEKSTFEVEVSIDNGVADKKAGSDPRNMPNRL